MNIADAITLGKKTLQSFSGTAEIDAELILASILKKDKVYLFQNPEEKIPRKDIASYKKALEQRKKGKPVAHITRNQEFFGLNIYINSNTLIPRPETEEVVEDVVNTLERNKDINLVLDIGTGSGCIALALANTLQGISMIALENSEKAIKVAEKNVKKYKLEKRIKLIRSDLLNKLPKAHFKTKKVIVANLPYIGTKKNNYIEDNVKQYEPKEALFGGEDGLDLYRKLMDQIIKKGVTFDVMFFEIGFSQTEAIEEEIKKRFPKKTVQILKDLAGFPRTVRIT
jgi:release factor glutamine methyltransferase